MNTNDILINLFFINLNSLARLLLDLKEIFKELEEAAKEVGLQVNEEKTKILVIARRTRGTGDTGDTESTEDTF